MDHAVATIIAEVLNQRGFILHDDVDARVPVLEGGFARFLQENENQLRHCGYTGGNLSDWSSSFRYKAEGVWSYGVVDDDWYWDEQHLNDALIDSYVFSICEGWLQRSGLLVRQLRPLMLSVLFTCSCGNVSKVPWEEIESAVLPTKPLFKLTGCCRACGKMKIPVERTVEAF
ncbi:hypothetical protein [Pseudogulbenkiania subflava]|uniref:Uncharacterized protein n=1 Tax=Pseudogulbenkiania subflava DSM 22618 TaxID=1123014 RepID=A0A1Y6BFH1_9NEIS|nr:hypothetical protein [Pseudogulbenkiania subflava]SMF08493.1 hypothetical protein SAMN02745746_01195 [Pseudogulbenkiania subflava DSM 22618]